MAAKWLELLKEIARRQEFATRQFHRSLLHAVSFVAQDSVATSWRSSRKCRRASLVWRPARHRIIGRANCRRLGIRCGCAVSLAGDRALICLARELLDKEIIVDTKGCLDLTAKGRSLLVRGSPSLWEV